MRDEDKRYWTVWASLDLASPIRSLRRIAGLGLGTAARLAGLAGPTSIQGVERGSVTVKTLMEKADAWGYEIRVQVRRKK